MNERGTFRSLLRNYQESCAADPHVLDVTERREDAQALLSFLEAFPAWTKVVARELPRIREHAVEHECLGHPTGLSGLMGRTIYCDGSCRRRTTR